MHVCNISKEQGFYLRLPGSEGSVPQAQADKFRSREYFHVISFHELVVD